MFETVVTGLILRPEKRRIKPSAALDRASRGQYSERFEDLIFRQWGASMASTIANVELSAAESDLFEVGGLISRSTPFWIQGAGGNISLKQPQGDVLRIKASGLRLDQVSPQSGLVDLRLSECRSSLQQLHEKSASVEDKDDVEEGYAQALTRPVVSASDPQFARPSMETGFHVALEAPLVAHFHALTGVLMADLWYAADSRFQSWAKSHLTSVFGSWMFVDWMKPGFELYEALATEECRDKKLIVMRNHGVILGLDGAAGFHKWVELENAFLTEFGFAELGQLRGKSIQDIVAQRPELRTGPMRFLFPDTAVFLERLEKALKSTSTAGGEEHFTFDVASTDRDALELWAGTQLLLKTKPDVSSLPHDFVAAVAKLPTERYRLSLNPSPRHP